MSKYTLMLIVISDVTTITNNKYMYDDFKNNLNNHMIAKYTIILFF